MADKKISQLTELAGNQIDYDNDVIAIVDDSAGETKKVNLTSVFSNVPSAASTSFGDINAVSANIGTGRFIVNSTNNGFVQMGSYGTGKFFQDQTASLATRFTLGINSEGKITEDQKVVTFKVSGSGFMNMNTKPKVLVEAQVQVSIYFLLKYLFYKITNLELVLAICPQINQYMLSALFPTSLHRITVSNSFGVCIKLQQLLILKT